MLTVIVILVILCVFILPFIVIKKKFNRGLQDSFLWYVKHRNNRLPYSTNDNRGAGKGLIYVPHAFTNWSLNPTYTNKFGDRVHTNEGFRKTEESDSIVAMLNDNPNIPRIVCIGGSSTYCTGIERYQDTWPSILKKRLNKTETLVFNFGVGGWGTIQSYIRCMTWLPVIKPQVLIFYQAKNDLTPLYNGAMKEKTVYPDYQNVMAQFSTCLSMNLPAWLLRVPLLSLLYMRKLQNGLSSIYKPEPWANPEGLKRITEEIRQGIMFRIESLIGICNMMKCKVLYVPEIVLSGAYAEELKEIYKYIPEIISKHSNAEFFDVRGIMPASEKYFSDKMHFTEEGCNVFAAILGKKLNEML